MTLRFDAIKLTTSDTTLDIAGAVGELQAEGWPVEPLDLTGGDRLVPPPGPDLHADPNEARTCPGHHRQRPVRPPTRPAPRPVPGPAGAPQPPPLIGCRRHRQPARLVGRQPDRLHQQPVLTPPHKGPACAPTASSACEKGLRPASSSASGRPPGQGRQPEQAATDLARRRHRARPQPDCGGGAAARLHPTPLRGPGDARRHSVHHHRRHGPGDLVGLLDAPYRGSTVAG